MKTTLFLILCFVSALMSGCATSRCSCCHDSCTAPGVTRSTYDPIKDVTTMEKDGNTWQLKGNVTNLVLTPKPPQ